uniref:FCP1 homology domain-containing protein n=1 Tax=Chromera velia CCMP2878 TaxID=1169474 RepID=A0A0G4G4G7_9ALVE|eukprot:Cvel_560.t1-p1 / transcript=Cvel_560.t1 / gene=Cvel_560 / organism=Chromera_velia_CCMP2878 / gene_product=hypothetical protein / transcript_product=hypothetical protein / location=Cvel_scaffold17:130040-141043(-) / protein_length=426 / sequence_SO=supercontig / SO=protein_coding / is_pseudo=false
MAALFCLLGEPASTAASDANTAPLPNDSDVIDVDNTSHDTEPSTPPTAAAAASSTGAVSGRRWCQREDPPSDNSDDEDFLPALSRSRSTSNRKKAKQGWKVKSSDGHCVHERIMNCLRCGLNFALKIRRSGNRETATIMATLPPGLYKSGNRSGSSSSAGGNGHGARAAASLRVGLAASAAAAAAGVAALSAYNRRNSFGATSTPPRSSSADGNNSTPSHTPTRNWLARVYNLLASVGIVCPGDGGGCLLPVRPKEKPLTMPGGVGKSPVKSSAASTSGTTTVARNRGTNNREKMLLNSGLRGQKRGCRQRLRSLCWVYDAVLLECFSAFARGLRGRGWGGGGIEKRRRNAGLAAGEVFSPPFTLILFDFDDTLFPTSWLQNTFNPNRELNCPTTSTVLQSLPQEQRDRLEDLELSGISLLTQACQ